MLAIIFSTLVAAHLLNTRTVMENMKSHNATANKPCPPLLFADIIRQVYSSMSTDGNSFSQPMGPGFTIRIEQNPSGVVTEAALQLIPETKISANNLNQLICNEVKLFLTGNEPTTMLYQHINILCRYSFPLQADSVLREMIEEIAHIHSSYRHMMWKKLDSLNGRLEDGKAIFRCEIKNIIDNICESQDYLDLLLQMRPPRKMPRSLLLGIGGFGRVHKADWPGFGEVAVKIILMNTDISREIANELAAMRLMAHDPHFVRLHHAQMSSLETVVVVMDYLRGEDGDKFFARLSRNGVIAPPKIMAAITRHLLLGLKVMHTQGLIHTDLKPQNMFLSAEGQVKILDLGLARHLDNPAECGRKAGTLCYAGPEIVNRKLSLNESSDVWTVGTTLVDLFTGFFPHYMIKDIAEYSNNVDLALRKIKNIEARFNPGSVNHTVCGYMLHFVKGCLEIDQAKRDTIDELLASPFIQAASND